MTGNSCDILIGGGGLVGASLACALSGQGLRIGVIEAVPYGASGQPSYDDRALALAAGTQRIFAALGLWAALEPHATPIHRIHVSDRGRFAFARLDRAEEGVPALGYVALGRDLGAVLGARLAQLNDVELICPARVAGVDFAATGAQVRIETAAGNRVLATRLLVAADGAQSTLRDLLDIPTTVWEYGQTALIANITTECAHTNIAYERFTDTGPLALLPMSENRCALVWTLRDDQVDAVMALDDAAFLARLQERFGQRLGRLTRVGQRAAYPLRLVRARESVRPRLALIGNAAHTLHPIAGQGFNLGLRDVAALAEVVLDAYREGRDIGDLAVLNRYADWRQGDHRRVIAFTDGLTRLFTNPLPPVAWVRDLGMLALDLCPPAKRIFAKLTMGRAGRLPRLARGLEL
ncbi:MAG: 2-octaprenyl-6-methoxyphenyl hydroxylase [Gammaproteobacteria bacterium]|nr:2-octaprenyl-6-methoxyphenyl hydroxylase [Gammaproteobacteria bacterium]